MKQQLTGVGIAVLGLLIVKFTGIDQACTNQITTWLVTLVPAVAGAGVLGHAVAKDGHVLGMKI